MIANQSSGNPSSPFHVWGAAVALALLFAHPTLAADSSSGSSTPTVSFGTGTKDANIKWKLTGEEKTYCSKLATIKAAETYKEDPLKLERCLNAGIEPPVNWRTQGGQGGGYKSAAASNIAMTGLCPPGQGCPSVAGTTYPENSGASSGGVTPGSGKQGKCVNGKMTVTIKGFTVTIPCTITIPPGGSSGGGSSGGSSGGGQCIDSILQTDIPPAGELPFPCSGAIPIAHEIVTLPGGVHIDNTKPPSGCTISSFNPVPPDCPSMVLAIQRDGMKLIVPQNTDSVHFFLVGNRVMVEPPANTLAALQRGTEVQVDFGGSVTVPDGATITAPITLDPIPFPPGFIITIGANGVVTLPDGSSLPLPPDGVGAEGKPYIKVVPEGSVLVSAGTMLPVLPGGKAQYPIPLAQE